ncbi:MAG: hypothetical protein IJ608_08495 [Lachnospiraceae bacterium]|nr:hypothetical protein [Lachnospiraceae bacterium]
MEQVFKSYLRLLLKDLKDLQKALVEDDKAKAKEIVDNLVDDTQAGLEDR